MDAPIPAKDERSLLLETADALEALIEAIDAGHDPTPDVLLNAEERVRELRARLASWPSDTDLSAFAEPSAQVPDMAS